MKWRDLIEEQPSAELNDRILRQANAELLRLRQSAQVTVPFWRRRTVLAGLAVGVFGVLVTRFFKTEAPTQPDALAMQDAEMLNNIELLNRLEMFEDFETIEMWNGTDV